MSDFYNKYPYTDFHELNLDWVIERVKKLTEDWAATLEEWHNTQEEWQQLYDYVHNYFDNLDVQQEINNKLDAMALDGSLAAIVQPIIDAKVAQLLPDEVTAQIGNVVADQIDDVVADQIGPVVNQQVAPYIPNAVTNWLVANVDPVGSAVTLDNTLSIQGSAADAEAVGRKTINTSEKQINTAGQATAPYNDFNSFPINKIVGVGNPGLCLNQPDLDGNVITFNAITNSASGSIQLMFGWSNNLISMRRKFGNVWQPWVNQFDPNNIVYKVDQNITENAANYEYNSLYKAITAAHSKKKPCRILVARGTYDIISEIGGTAAVDALIAGGSKGPVVGNGMDIICEAGTVIEAIYSGSSEDTMTYFSILNVDGSFSIHNAELIAENIRYCVHEDIPVLTTLPRTATVLYKNCIMHHNGTVSANYHVPLCIGAGCYYNTLSIVDSCIFYGNTLRDDMVSYHNFSAGGEHSIVKVLNCLFTGTTTLSLDGFQPSGSIVDAYVSNNSFGSPIDIQEAASRISLTEWNNEYR